MSRIQTSTDRIENISMQNLGSLYHEYQRLTQGDFRAIIAFHLALSCGLRKSEMQRIRWEHFDQERSCLAIPECMRDCLRTVPVTKELAAALDQIQGTQRSGLLFPSPQAFRWYSRQLARAGLNLRLDAQPSFGALRKCGMLILFHAGVSQMAPVRAGFIRKRFWANSLAIYLNPTTLQPEVQQLIDLIFKQKVTPTGQ